MICTKLTISTTNIDLNGTWYKDDVELEMSELGNTPTDNTAWIEWILDHDFDSELSQHLVDTIKDNAVADIHFRLPDGHRVHIDKTLRNE